MNNVVSFAEKKQIIEKNKRESSCLQEIVAVLNAATKQNHFKKQLK